MNYEAVIFDFDGVLCLDLFYANLKEAYPEVSNFINEKVFNKNSDIPDKWMRAELTTHDVNKFISDNTNINFDELSALFTKSVEDMKVDERLLNLARSISLNDGKVAIVTNNMDVFNTITINNHNLDKIFPVIVNSFDYGILKHDNDGMLFDIALKKLGIVNYENVLLIDDSSKARAVFKSKGGKTFAFNKYEQFEPWFKENFNKFILTK